MVLCFYFIHSNKFLNDELFQRLEANKCENTSFVQVETRTIVPRTVNLNFTAYANICALALIWSYVRYVKRILVGPGDLLLPVNSGKMKFVAMLA